MYYNTTNAVQPDLKEYWGKTENQDSAVLHYFTGYAGEFTPEDIHTGLIATGIIPRNTPLTSIRRSITNLTQDGKLIKTDTKKIGSYGRPNYCWKLSTPQLKLF